MKISISPKPQFMVNAFLMFFIVHSIQIGVGVQGFQRIIYLQSKQDAWVSVIIAGIVTHIIAWLMIKTLSNYDSADIYGIQYDVFGKWIGTLLNCLYIIYCLMAFILVLRNYIEVVQAWIFPELSTWFLSATLLVLVIYGITSGIRVIVGISFFSIVLSLWMLVLLVYPLQFANFDNFLPLFESNIKQLLLGAHRMTFTILGFEILYFVYPYVKEKDKVQKYTQLALFSTTLVYLAVMLVSLAYFSGGQLERTIWGSLSLFKIIRFPFMERMEYVAIAFWMFIILPNMLLYLWAATRGMNRIFNFNEKKVVWIFSIFILIATVLMKTRIQINTVNGKFGNYSFYIVFCYPILLYIVTMIKRKFKSATKENS
ncbi:GerAB/ArcD/ProY family transporter [Peribacillus alkalitolerans]|uniref:GerAB/ArcD/ProY family transporter n=1 Tax=Peribacillus alkalitolerans TaxID=1550385 RepID=UPI0013D1D30A|nr:GerAB/ArcD/ProY family transporter [Peribacillus alkalitolerans]